MEKEKQQDAKSYLEVDMLSLSSLTGEYSFKEAAETYEALYDSQYPVVMDQILVLSEGSDSKIYWC